MATKPPPLPKPKRVPAAREPGLSFDTLFDGLAADQATWLRFFLDPDNPKTFMRPRGAADAAGISYARGSMLRHLLGPRIKWFLAECGLDETSIRMKLVELMHAHETKVITVPGRLETWDVPENAEIVGVFQRPKISKDGELVPEDVTVFALRMESKELQRKALDMAIKLQGLYAPERQEVTGKDGAPLYAELTDLERAARIESILDAARARRAESSGG